MFYYSLLTTECVVIPSEYAALDTLSLTEYTSWNNSPPHPKKKKAIFYCYKVLMGSLRDCSVMTGHVLCPLHMSAAKNNLPRYQSEPHKSKMHLAAEEIYFKYGEYQEQYSVSLANSTLLPALILRFDGTKFHPKTCKVKSRKYLSLCILIWNSDLHLLSLYFQTHEVTTNLSHPPSVWADSFLIHPRQKGQGWGNPASSVSIKPISD